MMRFFPLMLLTCFISTVNSQTVILPQEQDSRVITTGTPFLLIASDPRAAGSGDLGVATSVDVFSQYWNPAKYAFATSKHGIGVSYTPYLNKIVNDVFLGTLSYYNRLDERSAYAVSFKYFSLGDIEFVDSENAIPLLERPNELTLDLSYALRLSEHFSLAVGLRYLRSDLKLNAVNADASSANTIGVDIGGYYQGIEKVYDAFNGRWRAGFVIQNIGPKFKYDDQGVENFQPTNLRLGGGFDFIFNRLNTLAVTTEFTKLLVPTPPIYGDEYNYQDNNANGQYDSQTDDLGAIVRRDLILKGNDPDINFLSGMLKSFGDAPGGAGEEFNEITWAIGAEYTYDEVFSLRTGYFNEHITKGSRKFFSLGTGFQFNKVNLDLSYLFSTSKVQSPLEGTVRFGLTFSLEPNSFIEL